MRTLLDRYPCLHSFHFTQCNFCHLHCLVGRVVSRLANTQRSFGELLCSLVARHAHLISTLFLNCTVVSLKLFILLDDFQGMAAVIPFVQQSLPYACMYCVKTSLRKLLGHQTGSLVRCRAPKFCPRTICYNSYNYPRYLFLEIQLFLHSSGVAGTVFRRSCFYRITTYNQGSLFSVFTENCR